MLALIYLIAATAFGDVLCRRFFRFESLPHRLSTAFLVGTLISCSVTYVFAVCFSGSSSPLLWANLTFFAFVGGACFLLVKYYPPVDDFLSGLDSGLRPPGNWRWDLLCIGLCLAFGYLLMFSMLTYKDGSINFTIGTWSDFGPHISLAQSLAFGNNYPTEHPFFPGEPIHYHFLFWSLSANLSYLGLNIVWAVNILSLFSLLALLVLMMTFAEKLFYSRAVGRITLIFFFLASSSLSYFPFLASQTSLSETFTSIVSRKIPLVSGFPYYGDGWGSLSVISFVNQRHLIPACGLMLIILIYLVDFYRRKGTFAPINEYPELEPLDGSSYRSDLAAMIFCGVLIGLLSYLNSAVLISAAFVFGCIFVLFPHRLSLLPLILAALAVGVPQLLILRSGDTISMSASFFNWGYIVSEPSFAKVLEYLAWTFGLKWLLLVVALWFVPGSHRRLLFALSTPLIAAFSFQFSVVMINNHKLLNVWALLISPFVAYGIWMIGRRSVVRTALAGIVTIVVVFGSIVDLFPIYNDGYIATPYGNDRLTNWVLVNTKPSDIFISEMWLNHPILFAGRKIFYGNTTFAWAAGYGGLRERDEIYKRILKTNDPLSLTRLLCKNNIAYIAVDDGFRRNENSRYLDESMLMQNFELAFDDTESKYGHLKIYRVP